MGYDMFDPSHFRTASQLLGMGLVCGGMVVKVPQILQIVWQRSGQGISLMGTGAETLLFMILSVYGSRKGYPFHAYGECMFMSAQSMVIFVLVMFYQRRRLECLWWMALYLGGHYILFIASANVLEVLQSCGTGFVVFSKGTQIYSNWETGSVGQLSILTVVLMTAGSCARVFTSIQHSLDWRVVIGNGISALLNTILLSQVAMYRRLKLRKE